MIISFDIDNTLIPYSNEFEVERRTLLVKILRAESMRKGTISLFNELENKRHEIWIYTTSFRSTLNLLKTFKAYGLNPTKIINEKTNLAALKKHNCKASKNPNLFGIDVHIDDSKGVEIEGTQYKFKTIIVDTNDTEWAEKILTRIELIELNLDWQFEQLIITLITLKSNAKRQKEICGFGNTGDEMVEDFDNHYTMIRKRLIQYNYISKSVDEKLSALDRFINIKSDDPNKDFWEELETHQDWGIIRGLAEEVLIEMDKDKLEVEVKHTNDYDEEGSLMVIRTETKLIGK